MEAEFVDWLRKRLSAHSNVELGLGDDAAILRWKDAANCVVTTDLLTDQVDFDLELHDPRRIGRKTLAVNLSDLAAMASRPVAAVISLALPRDGALRLAQELYEGLIPLAEEFDVAIAGGDTNCWQGPLAVSVTAIGAVTPHGALRRDGARPNDVLMVTGTFGGSLRGKQFDFTPRVREALDLNANYNIHAALDVSDGLSLDISRLAQESGCGACLDLDTIPVSQDAYELSASSPENLTPLERALSDGEDFELVLAVPSKEAERLLSDQALEVPITRIGVCTAQPGLTCIDHRGRTRSLAPRGFEH